LEGDDQRWKVEIESIPMLAARSRPSYHDSQSIENHE